MKYAFAFDHRDEFELHVQSRVLEFSRSGYYAWAARDISGRTQKELLVKMAIEKIFLGSRSTYGSPRVHNILRGHGFSIGEDTVARYMRSMGLRAKQKKKYKVRTTDSNHSNPIAENILQRNFHADAPGRIWLSDITYVYTDEGWLYLTAILDLCTREVVGWNFSESLAHYGALAALEMAVQRKKPAPGLIFHTDRGVQFACAPFRDRLLALGYIPSMSRRGDCWDNAPMESFFHTTKTEYVYHEHFYTRKQAKAGLFEWIEVFYNRIRIHSSIGYKTPVEFGEGFMLTEAMVG
jgi:transposase InsO family protein